MTAVSHDPQQQRLPAIRFGRRSRAVAQGCLLVSVLLICNFAVARFCPTAWDLTGNRAFTLSPQTRDVLAKLSQPVEITVLTGREVHNIEERSFRQSLGMLRELLELYRKSHTGLTVRELEPQENALARQLLEQYPYVAAPAVVIVSGQGDAARHEVLHARDLVNIRATPTGQTAAVDFLGEQAITAALSRLSSGKQQSVIYYLTGHGELDPAKNDPRSPRGMGTLASRLRMLDCELRPLDLQTAQRVPSDADLILLAGPEQPFSANEADALGVYLKHGGKALLLFDAVHDPLQQKNLPNGLEELLAEFGVLLGDDRVITRGFTGQLDAASPALPAAGEHPLVRALPVTPLTLFECRSVRILSSTKHLKTNAFPLLVSRAFPQAWAEGDPNPRHAPQPGGPNDLEGPVAMALAVEGQSSGTPQPVLVVVGDAEFASNRALSEGAGRTSYRFLLSAVSWLRGKKDVLADIPPQRHEPYQLSGTQDEHRGMVWKSTLLLCVLVITCGATVWTSRSSG